MRGKGTKLGEHCPKVRLSQDRMPIEPFGITGFVYVFGIFYKFQDCFVRDCYIRDNYAVPCYVTLRGHNLRFFLIS